MLDDLRELVALGKAGHRDEALARLGAGETKPHMDKFRADIHDIRAEEERLLVERRVEASSRGRLALAGAVLLTLASCGLLALGWRREAAHESRMNALTTDARKRLQALSELAAALSSTRTRRRSPT